MIRHLFPSVLLLCSMATAQTEQSEPTRNPAEAGVFRVDVNLIQMDAVVTDKEGRPVTDLTADDFTILQDGKPQEITNFSLVRLRDPIVPRPAVMKQSSKSREAVFLPPIRLKKNEIRRVIALVVDDLGLSFSNMVRSREAIRKWVDEEMRPGDLVAVITTGSGMGGLQQFTGDKNILYNAIDRIRFNVLSRVGITSFRPVNEEIPPPEGEIIRRLLGTLEAMRYVLNGMGTLPGRKSLMLFSEHLQIHFDDGGIMSMSLSDLVKEKLRHAIQDANRAGIVIHVIDPRGAVWTETRVDDTLSPVNASGGGLELEQLMKKMNDVASGREVDWLKSREGLFIMPGETGGLYIPHHNDVEIALQEAVNDGENYYLIGYRPDAETVAEMRDNRNKFHDIKVRVKRPGLQVRSRSGFFSSPETPYPPAPTGDALMQAMLSPLLNDDLQVHLASGYVHSSEGEYLLRTWVHLPGRQLTVLRDGNGEHYISLETYAATTGFDGLVRDSDRMEHKIPLNTQDVLSVREHGLRFSVTIPAKDPGAYFVRLAMKDLGSGKIGSAYQYVEIPDLKKEGLSLSDLFAVNRKEDLQLILSETGVESAEQFYSTGQNREKSHAIRQYQPGESLEYLALIYHADSRQGLPPELETQTVLYRDGTEIFRSDPEAVDLSGVSDPARIPIKRRLRLGKTMPPGDYMLQLQVRDRQAKKDQSLAARSLDFEVIPEQEPTNLEKAELSIRRGNEANRAGNKDESAQAFAEAARLYREELESNPDDTVLWKQTGIVSFLAGERDQAVTAYEEAVRLNPEDAESHYMLGIIRATTDVNSAIGDFREAVRLNPDNAKYHFDLGRALAQIKDFASSMEAFREASRLDPEDGESHASMGIVLEQIGEMEEAVAEYRKALMLDLTDKSTDSVRQLLAEALEEEEEGEDTVKRQEYLVLKIKQWRAAVDRHIPGEPDAAAVEVGSWPVNDLNTILYLVGNIHEGKLRSYFPGSVLHLFKGRRYITENIIPLIHLPDDPNRLLKRAALMHTDIAMFQLDTGYAPEVTRIYYEKVVDGTLDDVISAEYGSGILYYNDDGRAYKPPVFRRDRISGIDNNAISVQDGRERVQGNETYQGSEWHWKFARHLLDKITPNPSKDEMVRKWYIAATAFMLSGRNFAYAENNLLPALELFSSDPLLFFYQGVLHEKYAAPSYQNAVLTNGGTVNSGSGKSELKKAREYFQKALKADPNFSEARLHLGRVKGLLGDHEEAVEALKKAAASVKDKRLRYYCSLYLGNELATLNRITEARRQFETAAELYPNAQAPLLSLSRLAHGSGDYESALAHGKEIFALPVKEDISEDPWWSYDVSPVLNAPDLISEMYEASGGLSPETLK
ncbi:MAG: VWA domain-containing protein [Acidobacteria bacterium]|nr:VWA domain-containing protein [Acidobacteriota bacterium]